MSKTVGIILINYKDYAERFLKDCRDSLRAQTYPAERTKIYIVDNAATSESGRYLQVNFPEAIILSRPDGNYAVASNLGFQQAAAAGCEYLVALNMDTEMAPDWLAELVRALDVNPAAALAQSKILLYPRDETERRQPKINTLGNGIHFLGFGYTTAYGEADREITGYPAITGYASGASLIIRAEIFQKIGGYTEDFYMYHDDLELGLKVRLIGQQIILAPQSILYHKFEFSRSTRMVYYLERNRYLTMLIYYPAYLLILIFPPALVMTIGLAGYAVAKGWWKPQLKVYVYFADWRNYVKIYRWRREARQLATVPFSAVAHDFGGKLEFQEIANPLLNYLINPWFNSYWRLIKKLF